MTQFTTSLLCLVQSCKSLQNGFFLNMQFKVTSLISLLCFCLQSNVQVRTNKRLMSLSIDFYYTVIWKNAMSKKSDCLSSHVSDRQHKNSRSHEVTLLSSDYQASFRSMNSVSESYLSMPSMKAICPGYRQSNQGLRVIQYQPFWPVPHLTVIHLLLGSKEVRTGHFSHPGHGII